MSVEGMHRRNVSIGAFLAAAAVIFSPSISIASPSDDDPAPVPHAVRVTGTPSAEMWETATPISNFVQREPHEGAQPSQRTEFRVAYDSTTMYVKVNAFDNEAEKIVGYLTRRDGPSPSDWIRVLVDSYHDRRTAYEFAVNPVGVKQDRYWFDDNSRDDSWDAVWDVVVSRDNRGWTAEFRIPFSQLRFAAGEAKTVGFAIVREIGRLHETVTWPLLARSANGYVSSFGELGAVTLTQPPKRLELVPYAVTSLTRQDPEDNPLLKHSKGDAAVGLDLKYAVGSGLTLTTTINPDFGQVEADPAVVNLSAFETFFSERRPFFVEGSGNLQFNLDCFDEQCTGLFYSRRIGRLPQGIENLPDEDGVYTAAPRQTTIIGAAKLTGRVGKYSVGAMQAFTQEEFATVRNGIVEYREPVEPLTSYSVGRVRREFDNQSTVGFMLTATNRRFGNSPQFLPDAAYTGGVDWDWRFAKRYAAVGYLVASSLTGSPGAIADVQENSRHYFQRPDATHVEFDPTRTSLAGAAGRFAIRKIGGQHVVFDSSVSFKSPGFDVNDVGFYRRADERTVMNWLQIKSETPTRWFRSKRINFNQWSSWNFGGDRLQSFENVNAHATWINNWAMGGGINFNQLAFDDRLTRGGPGGLSDGFFGIWSYVTSDDRRPVWFNVFFFRGRDGLKSSYTGVGPEVTFRPMTSLSMSAGVHLEHNINDYQWVENVTNNGDHYVFGHLDQTTVGVTGRVNYSISPTLSLQLYAQPFVSGGAYTGFKELVDGRNPDYYSRYSPYAYQDNPDFNYKTFRSTNVLRWEYKPGSTLFVVWQQGREDSATYGDFRFGRDFRGIFHIAPQNVFLVKLAYWLNY
jgi:Domain of unknown function (DUF5916)/Carbohydrate family 9 binding domain-like